MHDLAFNVAGVALIVALFFAFGCGPDVDDVDDEPPALQSDCPGGLLCECEVESECDDHGLGGARATCGPAGFCTRGCSEIDPCDVVLPNVVCGPTMIGAVPVCALLCDELELEDDCEPLGMAGALCGPDLLCAYP